jgi:hypothetical protein
MHSRRACQTRRVKNECPRSFPTTALPSTFYLPDKRTCPLQPCAQTAPSLSFPRFPVPSLLIPFPFSLSTTTRQHQSSPSPHASTPFSSCTARPDSLLPPCNGLTGAPSNLQPQLTASSLSPNFITLGTLHPTRTTLPPLTFQCFSPPLCRAHSHASIQTTRLTTSHVLYILSKYNTRPHRSTTLVP